MPVAVKTRGIPEAKRPVERLTAALSRFDWFWADVLQAFTERERRWFDAEGEGDWAPLSPTYAAWKAMAFPGQPLMVLSGDMRDQLTSPEKALLFRSEHMIVMGSTLPYAGFHHTGTRKMPKRDPLAPTERIAGGIIVRLRESLRLISRGGMGI